eukprot:jgi/Botrbrau1/20398/Bobra.0006s0058.1
MTFCLHSLIGFNGLANNSLLLHPDGRTLIHALGNDILLRDISNDNEQHLLHGHTQTVWPSLAHSFLILFYKD